MISEKCRQECIAKLQGFFGQAFFNEHRLKIIFDVVKPLSDSQLERIVEDFCMKEQKPGVNDFAFKVREYQGRLNYNPQSFENHEACKHCGDVGIVFVKTERESPKSLAMCCFCECAKAKRNFWELPVYSADYCMIESPYSAAKSKGKMTWQKAAEYFGKHMIISKKVWNGEM